MSHRNLSWLLTFIAFFLFALACTLGRNAKEDGQSFMSETVLVSIEAESKTKLARFPSDAITADCAIEAFHTKYPLLAKKMNSVLADTIKIKLAEEISSLLQENPEQVSEQVIKCIARESDAASVTTGIAEVDY